MKTLILGLGNPILRDDAVGLIVARRVYDAVQNGAGDEQIDLVEASIAWLNVLDVVQGYDKVIVVDSVQTTDGVAGDLYEVELDDVRITPRLKSPHGVDFALALEMGRTFGARVPTVVRIYAIEVTDPFTFSEALSPEVSAAVPAVVAAITRAEFGKQHA